jgi:hypothetical protein
VCKNLFAAGTTEPIQTKIQGLGDLRGFIHTVSHPRKIYYVACANCPSTIGIIARIIGDKDGFYGV